MTNREQLILSKNKFEQADRTTVQASNSLENIYVPRTSRVTNIFKKFTNLAGQNHSSDGHEAGCFNRDLTKGQGGLSFLSKKTFFYIHEQKILNFISNFENFLITSQNFTKFIFFRFWPA